MNDRRCCVCDVVWSDPLHLAQVDRDCGGSVWRGNLGQLIPYRQWVRENFPSSRDGVTVAGDDGFLRFFSDEDPIGVVCPWEWKTFGKPLDRPTAHTFAAFREGAVLEPVVIRLIGGNTPGPLLHYPSPCDCCGLPERPETADAIQVNGSVFAADRLVDWLLQYLGDERAWLADPVIDVRVAGGRL
jgi:hypothetical protein